MYDNSKAVDRINIWAIRLGYRVTVLKAAAKTITTEAEAQWIAKRLEDELVRLLEEIRSVNGQLGQ